MEITGIPTELDTIPVSCFVLTGEDTLRVYADGSTTGNRYTYQNFVIRNEKLYPSGALVRSNTNYLSSYTCIDPATLTYKPETEIYFQFLSFVLVVFVFIILYRLVLRRLLP